MKLMAPKTVYVLFQSVKGKDDSLLALQFSLVGDKWTGNRAET